MNFQILKATNIQTPQTAGWEIKHQSGKIELLTPDQFFKRTIEAAQMREMVYKDELPKLKVYFGSMPESNGKTNWTATLYRDNGSPFDFAQGITVDRSEFKDQVRYCADCLRFLIGEIDMKPNIKDYDPTLHGSV